MMVGALNYSFLWDIPCLSSTNGVSTVNSLKVNVFPNTNKLHQHQADVDPVLTCYGIFHYNNKIWASRRLKSPATRLFVQAFDRLTLKNMKHQSHRYWPFVRVIHRWSMDSPHKGPATQEASPFNDVIMPCGIGRLGGRVKRTVWCGEWFI